MFFHIGFLSFLCAAENLSPNGFKTVLDIDTQGTFNMCRAVFPEVHQFSIHLMNLSFLLFIAS